MIRSLLITALLVVSVSGCDADPAGETSRTNTPGKATLVKSVVGRMPDGAEVHEYTLTNANGLEAKVLAPENLTMWEGVEEEKMAEIYGMMDCLVHPSYGEGFGLPVLEAMACGIPVIASKNSSLPEVVGDAGILVECDPEPYFTREGWVHHRTKISALRDAMELVFRDEELRGRLARMGVERASEFTWERACEEMKKAIEKAMRHHRLSFLRRGKDHEAEGFLSEREISEQGDAEDKERPPEVCSSRRGADG